MPTTLNSRKSSAACLVVLAQSNMSHSRKAGTGRPFLFVLQKIRGALRVSERAYKTREDVYRFELPAETALVISTAFFLGSFSIFPLLLKH